MRHTIIIISEFIIFANKMYAKKNIVFILNPKSGNHGKNEIPAMIAETLDKNKFDYQVKFTEYAGHATQIARQCVEDNIDIVVAVGGDGTVNETARAIVHSNNARHNPMRIRQWPGTPLMYPHRHP